VPHIVRNKREATQYTEPRLHIVHITWFATITVLARDQIKEWSRLQMAAIRGVVLCMATPTHPNCLPPYSYKMSIQTGDVWPFRQIDFRGIVLFSGKPTPLPKTPPESGVCVSWERPIFWCQFPKWVQCLVVCGLMGGTWIDSRT
jgi:hypothetical protein